MAARYWVGGTGTWDASNTANWSTTSGGAGGASVPGSADTVFFNASSGVGTVTLGYNPTVVSVDFTGFTQTFDGVGSTYTITVNGTTAVWTAVAGMTLSNSPNITLSSTAGSAFRTFAGGGKTYGKLTIGGSTGGGTGLTITGANTFGELASTKTVAHIIYIATNQTVTTWSVKGSSGNLVTLRSSSSGTASNLTITNRTTGIDYLEIIDIACTNLKPVTFYVGSNSILRSNVVGVAATSPTANKYIHVLTSGTTWSTPGDWNNSNNEIHLFAGGGGGAGGYYSNPNGAGGSGGGGGGYTKANNVTLSGSISYAIGAGGSGASGNANGGNGGSTTFKSGTYSAGGGGGGTATSTSSTGGAAGTGSTYNGGVGGAGSLTTVAGASSNGSGGGGGAGGPLGAGGNGGNGFAGGANNLDSAGGGGGGNGGGSAGGNASSATGGAGGNNNAGVGGGVFPGANPYNGGGGAGGVNGNNQGQASGIDIANAGMGSSSGFGGGGVNNSTTIRGGFFGGGGNGGGVLSTGTARAGVNGSQGGIVIIYTAASPSYTLSGANGSYSIAGKAATFTKSVSISAANGSYAITGQSATLSVNKNYSLSANYGSYALTGQNATLSVVRNYQLDAAYGQYSIAGQNANLTLGTLYSLSAEYGSYVLTGRDANLEYQEAPAFIETRGGIPKAKSSKKHEEEKSQREELEALVKKQFDILDGTYKPEAVEAAKQEVMPKIAEIKQFDDTEYRIAFAQVNALLLQAKIKAAEYEAELDDEEAILMLL